MSQVTLSTSARNSSCDAIVDLIDTGSGTSATLNLYTTGLVLLATLEFPNPAFGAATAGVATANTVTDEMSAVSTGTAAKFDIKNKSSEVVLSGTVGATGAGADLSLNTTSIVIGDRITLTSLTVTMPTTSAG